MFTPPFQAKIYDLIGINNKWKHSLSRLNPKCWGLVKRMKSFNFYSIRSLWVALKFWHQNISLIAHSADIWKHLKFLPKSRIDVLRLFRIVKPSEKNTPLFSNTTKVILIGWPY